MAALESEFDMTLTVHERPTLAHDPVGDALADCYTFLLRKLDEKSGARTGLMPVKIGKDSEGSARGETEARQTESLGAAD